MFRKILRLLNNYDLISLFDEDIKPEGSTFNRNHILMPSMGDEVELIVSVKLRLFTYLLTTVFLRYHMHQQFRNQL